MHAVCIGRMSTPDTVEPKTVRTSISLSRKVKERADQRVETDGFSSFSDLVEYLLRRDDEIRRIEHAA